MQSRIDLWPGQIEGIPGIERVNANMSLSPRELLSPASPWGEAFRSTLGSLAIAQIKGMREIDVIMMGRVEDIGKHLKTLRISIGNIAQRAAELAEQQERTRGQSPSSATALARFARYEVGQTLDSIAQSLPDALAATDATLLSTLPVILRPLGEAVSDDDCHVRTVDAEIIARRQTMLEQLGFVRPIPAEQVTAE